MSPYIQKYNWGEYGFVSMLEALKKGGRSVLFVSVLVVLVALCVGTGTAAAQSAPDCSTISYNGDGTTSNPYEVSNVDQLQCINEQGLNANYVQVSDIDAAETASWDDVDGFEPIGRTSLAQFNGTFNGQGYEITSLSIDLKNRDNIGLFGFVNTDGEVTNVSVVDADIIGNRIGGSIVGENDGTVSNSYATGSVNTFRGHSGGLVGLNQKEATVTESYATVSVNVNTSIYAGGLVGLNAGTVNKSYATGSVDGDSIVGGLAGENDGTVSNSYATGNVSGSSSVGGLVGANAGTVSSSYATGSVNSSEEVGGVVGADLFGQTVNDSYWDVDTTGQSSSEGGTGLTTSEMTGSAATSNMTGFDFTSTWETVPGDYPILAWQTDGDRGTSASGSDSNGNAGGDEASDGESDGNSGGDGGNTSANSTESEGLPGFTVVTAALALLTVFAVGVRRRTK
jgi:hypothetical protein